MLFSSFPVLRVNHRIKRGENQRKCPALSKQGIDRCGDPSTRGMSQAMQKLAMAALAAGTAQPIPRPTTGTEPLAPGR